MKLKTTAPRLTLSALLTGLLALAAAAQSPAPPPPIPAPPDLDARSYILVDHHTGKVLAEKDADLALEPASLTKLMTAYVVFGELQAGRLDLQDFVTVSERAWRMGGSKMFIEVGRQVTVEDLLRGMIVQSGNDASIALAEHIAGTEENFAVMMEQQARALGLDASAFRNATGMPAQAHVVTARDIATLSRRLIADFPQYYPLYAERSFTFSEITQPNRNPLLGVYPGADGLKTGHTEAAGYCLASSAERDGMRLISVVMGSSSPDGRASASRALLNYGFRFFATHRLYEAGQALERVRVWKGTAEEVPLGIADDIVITIPRGSYERLQATTTVPARTVAPLQPGETVGRMRVVLDGAPVVDVPLVTLAAVPEAGFAKKTWDQVMMWFN